MLRRNRPYVSSLFLSAMFFSSVALADSFVVYSAKGADFKSGQIVDGSKSLNLTAGQEVSLISPNGQILKLTGPYQDVPMKQGDAQRNNSVKDAIKNLLSTPEKEGKSFGISRSADDVFKLASQPNALPDPWLIDVTKDGPVCHLEGKGVVFWRADKSKESTVSVRIQDDAWEARAVWSSGKSKLALPPAMPLLDGKVYHIGLDAQKVQAVMNIIPSSVQSEVVQAVWMREKGCTVQFQALARSLM